MSLSKKCKKLAIFYSIACILCLGFVLFYEQILGFPTTIFLRALPFLCFFFGFLPAYLSSTHPLQLYSKRMYHITLVLLLFGCIYQGVLLTC